MRRDILVLGTSTVALVALAGCAPGNEQFTAEPAGFWMGLWHGFICCFTFLISLFNDGVRMYEVHNAGRWYDFGFLLGAACLLGGGSGGSCAASKRRCDPADQEWEEIGAKVEAKVRRGIRRWLDEAKEGEKEWEEIGRKVEEKIKRELRDWADK